MDLVSTNYISTLIETIAVQVSPEERAEILAPVQPLVEQIERQGVQIQAVDRLSDGAKSLFQGSFAVKLPDGKRAIILERAAIQQVAGSPIR